MDTFLNINNQSSTVININNQAKATEDTTLQTKLQQPPLFIITASLNSLVQELNQAKTLMNDMQTKVRLIEKNVAALTKEKEKEKIIKKKPEIKVQPHASGFDTPVAITDELCAFMHKPNGTLVTRLDVTDYLLNYIRMNGLQDMTARKKIKVNEPLCKLFRLAQPNAVPNDAVPNDAVPNDAVPNAAATAHTEVDITYFNLHKYLQIHYLTA